MKKKIKIIHIGVSGFPFVKSASINRCSNLYAVLIKEGFNVHFINNKTISDHETSAQRKNKGEYLGITYQFTPPILIRPNGFLKRRYNKFQANLKEFVALFYLKNRKETNIFMFYPKGSFLELFYYRCFSKFLGIRMIGHYVEYRSSFDTRKNFWTRINDFMFDKYFMFFVDGMIPISSYLLNHINSRRDIPTIKVPPVADFNIFSKVNIESTESFFLFVGGTVYVKTLDLILNAFDLLENQNFHLKLVLHGPGMNKIMDRIGSHSKKDMIKVYSNLNYMDLISLYKNAKAHLIPLSNTVQDTARFPNKISEYLASGRPVITTNIGEIDQYFKDMVNALIAKSDDPNLFMEKMQYIVNFPRESERIGEQGYKLGFKFFNNWSYSNDLKIFIEQIVED